MEKIPQRTFHSLAGKHIIVAGAGIAGLAFIRALDRNWPLEVERPHITLYERDGQELSPEREGYSLGIRSDRVAGGLQALQRLGLLDETLQASTTGSRSREESVVIRDANWNTLLRKNQPKIPPDGLPRNDFRIARYALRQQLVLGMPQGVQVHWNSACTSASQLKNGKMQVVLSDESMDECDLLVVADGANSKLRNSLRPDDTLNFAGAVIISATARFPDGNVPERVKNEYGPVLSGEGTGLVVFPLDEKSCVWSITYRSPKPRTPMRGPAALKAKDEILDEARNRGRAFAEPFQQLVAAADPSTLTVFNAMDKPPVSHSRVTEKPVVFIGDSNHAVSPFAGNGANMALMDGLQLAEALRNTTEVSTAVSAFDKLCIPRAKRSVQTSHIVIWMIHSTGWKLWLCTMLLRLVNFMTR